MIRINFRILLSNILHHGYKRSYSDETRQLQQINISVNSPETTVETLTTL